MKVTVDRDACTGCELCATTCPEVFEMDDQSLAKVIADPVPAASEACAKEAADTCPAECSKVA